MTWSSAASPCGWPPESTAWKRMVVVPGERPRTTPLLSAMATAGLVDVGTIVRPNSWLPAASCAISETRVVPPTRTVVLVGATTTRATGAAKTVKVPWSTTLPGKPGTRSTTAWMTAWPGVSARARPVEALIETIAELLLCQTMRRSVRTRPSESKTVALYWKVPPGLRSTKFESMSTAPTGNWVTVTVVGRLTESTRTMTCVVPTFSGSTMPEPVIRRTVGSATVNASRRPAVDSVRGGTVLSSGAKFSVLVAPTRKIGFCWTSRS